MNEVRQLCERMLAEPAPPLRGADEVLAAARRASVRRTGASLLGGALAVAGGATLAVSAVGMVALGAHTGSGATPTTTAGTGQVATADLGVTTSDLTFQPPASMPDVGIAKVTIANRGTIAPASISVTFVLDAAVDRISPVNPANGSELRCANWQAGADGKYSVVCTVRGDLIPEPGNQKAFVFAVKIASPPQQPPTYSVSVASQAADHSTIADRTPANNTATAGYVR